MATQKVEKTGPPEALADAAAADDEVELITTPYGIAKPVVLKHGTLVAELQEWKLTGDATVKVYLPWDVEDGEEDKSASNATNKSTTVKDDSIMTLKGHTDSVYAVAVTSYSAGAAAAGEGAPGTMPICVATGGGDDLAYLWDAAQGKQIAKLQGHTDSVIAVAFNHNGNFVATGAYDCTVKVWHARGPKLGKLAATLEGPAKEIEWIQWHKHGNILLAGSSDGSAWMWLGPKGMFMQVFAGHEDTVHCGCFSANGKLVVTGSGDGTLRVWDPKTGRAKHKFQGHLWHQGAVVSVSAHHKRPIVISGGDDGTVCISQIKKGKILCTFSHASAAKTHRNSTAAGALGKAAEGHGGACIVESVGFATTHNWAASGSIDGTLCVWDLKTSKMRCICDQGGDDHGITRLSWHTAQPLIFTGSLDGLVRQWDARSGTCMRQWEGHQNIVLDLAFCMHLEKPVVVTSSDDQTAKIFSLV